MIRSKRALAAGFAIALAGAGIGIGASSGSIGASAPGGLCEGLDLGGGTAAGTGAAAGTEAAMATEAAAGTEAAMATEAPAATAAAAEGSAAATEGGTNVALLFDVTGRGDRSFNDSAAAGLDRATAELGITPSESTPTGDGDRAERMTAAVEGGNQIVIAVGFLWGGTLAEVAPQYPDTDFAIIDDGFTVGDNIANLTFAEEQGSFLVGAAAALASESGHIGFVGGATIDLIRKFEAGYIAGAQCINPDITIDSEYVSDDPAVGFNDAARGKEIGAAMYEAGADVVYAAAGASGTGVLEATSEAGEPGEVWNIGVDSDLYEQVDAALQPYVLTSMLKRVDVATYTIIEAEVNGTFAAGPQVFDLSVDGVGYSTSGGFVDEYAPTLETLKALIIDGTIVVPTVPEG